MAVVTITGDVAYSGKEEQYLAFAPFLARIRDSLASKLRRNAAVPVHVVAVPGNHDVDHAQQSSLRPLVVESVLGEPRQARDPEVVAVCTRGQAAFFDFIQSVSPGGRVQPETGYPEHLYYEYRLHHGGETVRFLCCNVAWLSRLHDIQGKLYFPGDALPDSAEQDALVVTLLHHNSNWIEANAARRFRERVEAVSDIVLSGHEHEGSYRTQDLGSGAHNIIVEAPVLQDSADPDSSGFQAFALDTRARKQKFRRWAWDGQVYARVRDDGRDAQDDPWTDFQVNRYRRLKAFDLTDTARMRLEDPGVVLTHRQKGAVHLPDIFVYPDVRAISAEPDDPAPVFRGEAIVDLVQDPGTTVICGPDQAGKTSLAKALVLDLHARGEVPVLIQGSASLPTDDRISRAIVRAFVEQYSAGAQEQYEQLDPDQRIVIMDDYHKVDGRGRRSIARALARFAGRVVLIANDVQLEAANLLRPLGTDDGWRRFGILPLGLARRGQLIERWMELGEGEASDGIEIAHRVADIERKLETIFGQNFVPPYPVFVLSVLQAAEVATPIDMTASTHGYFYEVFIRAALARQRSDQADYDIILAYLSHVAYGLFMRRGYEVNEAKFREIHRSYEQKFALSVPFERTVADLVARRILDVRSGGHRFKYRYLYYYFVAAYMANHLDEPAVREQVQVLSRLLHVEEYANIVLFLAHLSKHPLIVGEVLAAARSFYPVQAPATFGDDVHFVGALTLPVVHTDRDTRSNRRELRERLDEFVGPADASAASEWRGAPPPEGLSSDQDMLDPVSRLNAAMKTLQIAGQFLKNFPGSIEAPGKQALTRACYELGLRAAAGVLEGVSKHEGGLISMIMEAIQQEHPRLVDAEVEQRARDSLAGLLHMMGLAMVQRIAFAVGSPKLGETYRQVVADAEAPSFLLIDAAVDLEQLQEFPVAKIRALGQRLEKNPYARWVLQQLVINHFYLFPEPLGVRQSICAALKIDYMRVTVLDPQRKLISRKP